MPKISVIQINVTDMDQAIDFYCNKLGFQIRSREHYPQIVKLEHQPTLLLYKVDRAVSIEYPHVAQTLVNIETDDLASTLETLQKAGVEVIHKDPVDCPVGIYAAVRDPSGNVLELLQYTRR